ncbi:MAG: GTP-binding protein [Promethearchaeota archaeon]
MVVVADGRYEMPDDLFYSREQHVYLDKDKKIIGLDQIGFAFLKNPTAVKVLVEGKVKIGEPFAVITTEQGITTLNSPCSGTIEKINESGEIIEKMKYDAYGEGYLIKLKEIEEIDDSLVRGPEIEAWAKAEVKSLLHGYYSFKVIEIGDSGTGKTAIKVRFTDNYFKQDLKTTLGVDFGSKELKCEYISSDPLFSSTIRFTAKMNVWDAAGQQHYEKIRGMYYRGAKGALLVYDVTNPISFQNLDKWLNELEENVGKKIPVLLVGNKIDLERKVPREQALEYAKKHGFLFIETSAKTGENVEEAFRKLAIEIFKQQENLD